MKVSSTSACCLLALCAVANQGEAFNSAFSGSALRARAIQPRSTTQLRASLEDLESKLLAPKETKGGKGKAKSAPQAVAPGELLQNEEEEGGRRNQRRGLTGL